MMTLDEKIAVMEAYRDGAKIEFCVHGRSDWRKCADIGPHWEFLLNDYRVAPPKKVRMWQWVVLDSIGSTPRLTDYFYTEEPALIGCRPIQRADWTMIEVDAELK